MVLRNTLLCAFEDDKGSLSFQSFHNNTSDIGRVVLSIGYMAFLILINLGLLWLITSLPLLTGVLCIIVLVLLDFMDKDFSKTHIIQVILNYAPLLVIFIK